MRKWRRVFAAFALAAALALSSCSGFAATLWAGSFRSTSYYTYRAPYAYIEGHSFYVYREAVRCYVIYRGATYYITIYDDCRVYAPRALIILLR